MTTDNKAEIIRFPYFINNVYSLSYWLKDYGYYPKSIPVFTYMDHGITLFDKIHPHEINNDAPLIFKFSPRLVELYKKHSKKPVYNLLNPAVHYRRSRGIHKATNGRGSLFFVGHTTDEIDDLTNWNHFIDSIRKLPAHFHPVDICLHPIDLAKGLGEVFKSAGFEVLSASNQYADDFMENFYRILRRYNFTISNLIGSYTFYSVDMGIPFSLYGDEPKFFNKSDSNIEKGAYESYKHQPSYQKAKELFSGLHTTISEEQSGFVNYELGVYSSISRQRAAFLLYKAYISYAIKYPRNFMFLKSFAGCFLKRISPGLYTLTRRLYRRTPRISASARQTFS